jgi:hypothetical protein
VPDSDQIDKTVGVQQDVDPEANEEDEDESSTDNDGEGRERSDDEQLGPEDGREPDPNNI